jgi:hypothetical protein
MQAVGRFFFGDGILGYTHPFLSERLAAAGAFAPPDEKSKEQSGSPQEGPTHEP